MTVEELLKIPSAFLTGSQAMGVSEDHSDWDIVMKLSSLKKYVPYLEENLLDITNYFEYKPSKGSTYLIRKLLLDDEQKCDIIVTDTDKIYCDLHDVTQYISKLPIAILKDKNLRIGCFHALLIERGWIPVPDTFDDD